MPGTMESRIDSCLLVCVCVVTFSLLQFKCTEVLPSVYNVSFILAGMMNVKDASTQ
jgi:hypothetical protein